jgi:hypothetical protein
MIVPPCASNNRPNNGQAHAHSFLFCGKEVIENFVRAVLRQSKIEIIPIRAALPAFKVLKNHEQARFRSGVDITGEYAFLCAKFESFQNAGNAQHADIVRFALRLYGS